MYGIHKRRTAESNKVPSSTFIPTELHMCTDLIEFGIVRLDILDMFKRIFQNPRRGVKGLCGNRAGSYSLGQAKCLDLLRVIHFRFCPT